MIATTVKDWKEAASLISEHAREPNARILIIGPPGSGKTGACKEACTGLPTLWWDISSGPPTMVGSSGLSRFFQGVQKQSEVVIIDNVDSSLAIEGNARSPGVSALLSIITDPMRQVVILTSTSEDPFKCLGTSSAGKTIRSSITMTFSLAPLRPSKLTKTPQSDSNQKSKEKDPGRHIDALFVLMLEAAAGYHSNDALLALAYDMDRILLTE